MHNADSRSTGCGTINIESDDAFPDGQCIGQFQFLIRAQWDWVVIYGFFREARAHRFFYYDQSMSRVMILLTRRGP